jgi:hypothetical protein
MLRSPFHSQASTISSVYGRLFGLWEILVVRGMVHLWKAWCVFLSCREAFVEYPFHSGRIAMMRVMLVPLQINQSVGNLLQRPSTGTHTTVAFYHMLLVNVCHGVHAKEDHIQDQCIQMVHM